MLCSNLHQSDKLQTLKTDAFKYAGEISDAYRAQPRASPDCRNSAQGKSVELSTKTTTKTLRDHRLKKTHRKTVSSSTCQTVSYVVTADSVTSNTFKSDTEMFGRVAYSISCTSSPAFSCFLFFSYQWASFQLWPLQNYLSSFVQYALKPAINRRQRRAELKKSVVFFLHIRGGRGEFQTQFLLMCK